MPIEKSDAERQPFLHPSDREPAPEPELDLERNENVAHHKQTRKERPWALWLRIAIASYLLGVIITTTLTLSSNGAIQSTTQDCRLPSVSPDLDPDTAHPMGVV